MDCLGRRSCPDLDGILTIIGLFWTLLDSGPKRVQTESKSKTPMLHLHSRCFLFSFWTRLDSLWTRSNLRLPYKCVDFGPSPRLGFYNIKKESGGGIDSKLRGYRQHCTGDPSPEWEQRPKKIYLGFGTIFCHTAG